MARGCRSNGAVISMSGPLQSSHESGPRAGYDGFKRKRDSKVQMAVCTPKAVACCAGAAGPDQEHAQSMNLRVRSSGPARR